MIYGNTGETDATVLHTTQSVYLDFSAGTTSGIVVQDCDCPTFIYNLKIKVSDTQGANCVWSVRCSNATVSYGYYLGAAKTTANSGININSSILQANANYVDNLYYGVYAARSNACSNNTDSTGTSCAYGLCSVNASVIGKIGANQPTGAIRDENADSGGTILPNYLISNTTVNFTSSMTAAQMQALIDAQPKNLNGFTLTFQFGNGTYSSSMTTQLVFRSFYSGYINIYGNTGESGLHTNQAVVLDFSAGTSNALYLVNCNCTVQISNIKLILSDNGGTGIYVNNVNQCFITGCYITFTGSRASYSYGIASWNNFGVVTANNNYVSNMYAAFRASSNNNLLSYSNSSTGTSPLYGLYVYYGGNIFKGDSTQPTGATSNEWGSGSTGSIIR